jgi:hypothetical protein
MRSSITQINCSGESLANIMEHVNNRASGIKDKVKELY